MLTVAALAACATAAHAALRIDPLFNDLGSFKVYFGDRLLGTEKFSFEPRGDSVLVFSNVDEQLPTPQGAQHLDKKMLMTIKAIDSNLLAYQSEQAFVGERVLRGITVHDTTLTTFREVDGKGVGDTYERPPGRMFVVDAQVFTLFDVMLRSMHGKMEIGERPLSVIVLGAPRDSLMDIQFRPGDIGTVEVDGRRRSARQVTLSDGTSEFTAWVAPAGHMLRLDQPATGMRIERADTTAASSAPRPGARRAPVASPKPSVTPPPPKRPTGR